MIGLSLEGGGAKGAYQFGAWKAFRELGMEFDGITGTSIGALNGALMIQEDYEKAREIWEEIAPEKILNIDSKLYKMVMETGIKPDQIQYVLEQAQRFVKDAGLDIGPLVKMIREGTKEDVIRKSKKDFGFVTVSLTDLKPLELFKEEVPEGKMADYLLASSYLPVFKPEKIDGKTFLDGGFYNNLPINMLYQKGYKKIVAVRLMSKGRIKKVDFEDLEVIYIQPKHDLGNILDFSKEKAEFNINLGYYDTLKVFQDLYGENYYLKAGITDREGVAFLQGLKEETLGKISGLLGLSTTLPKNRLALEELVPKLVQLLGCRKEVSYGELVLKLLEEIAAHEKVELFKIYGLEEFMEEINSKRRPMKKSRDTLFQSSALLLRFNKDIILEELIKIILTSEEKLSLQRTDP
ncbi:patatin-like phospholipase family protein [Isachenkonia alkalipeptolytica]|uniref:Patatin-like phospholipase family protein n=1 Tax=Isachenkonia alkalipeptolytica TaxID=2565777 RepID=A0AA43XJP0_9CLOT|nr:patatin-like phospholipase family protein [Isachenkonia alkalipeptolytica]NBG88068.1 patatin-like phospholipase family protein [Isachenkonia alkalipeptolytica]